MAQERAIFAAGCFWGVEAAFRKVSGVTEAVSGYIGGHVENPTYEQVCYGTTEHAEAVEVVFDPGVVSYESLLDTFWKIHDPTQVDRQGPDVGRQYRSAIFCVGESQKEAAVRSMEKAAADYSKPIATEVVDAPRFWPAEDYHQRYLEKRSVFRVFR